MKVSPWGLERGREGRGGERVVTDIISWALQSSVGLEALWSTDTGIYWPGIYWLWYLLTLGSIDPGICQPWDLSTCTLSLQHSFDLLYLLTLSYPRFSPNISSCIHFLSNNISKWCTHLVPMSNIGQFRNDIFLWSIQSVPHCIVFVVAFKAIMASNMSSNYI